MSSAGAQKEIIREALARACYDADEKVFEAFTLTALSGRPRSMDPASYLAQRVARELAHAGYSLKSARYCKGDASKTAKRMALEDLLADAITNTPYSFRAALGSADRSIATSARTAMADKIIETFHFMKVVLRYRAPPT